MRLMTFFVAMLLLVLSAGADEQPGTAAEAQDMVARAIALYDEMGASEAMAKLTADPAPEFRDRDLYVFVYDPRGVLVAHGVDPQVVGRLCLDLVDETGKRPCFEMWERADENGVWVDYRWPNPVSGQIEDKSSWMVRHDGYLFGVGIYTP